MVVGLFLKNKMTSMNRYLWEETQIFTNILMLKTYFNWLNKGEEL